ncbi:hypothetical protein [Maritimibacter sp. 55A14]|uniref:hypothetical protein n=1 Tax=Maritimibacter sp. 55A14 TaxID=2174844 RepID=UPI0011B279DE|nr:hypothetical protein [Maritimibacter sp. 55A14]
MAKMVVWTFVTLTIALISYNFGFKSGRETAPDSIAYERERDAKLDRDLDVLLKEPTAEECLQFVSGFDGDIEQICSNWYTDEQERRHEMYQGRDPDYRGRN